MKPPGDDPHRLTYSTPGIDREGKDAGLPTFRSEAAMHVICIGAITLLFVVMCLVGSVLMAMLSA